MKIVVLVQFFCSSLVVCQISFLTNLANDAARQLLVPAEMAQRILQHSTNFITQIGHQKRTPFARIFPEVPISNSINAKPDEVIQIQNEPNLIDEACSDYKSAINNFERKLYGISFETLAKHSPPEKKGNGISFAQSGLFVYLALLAFSTATNNMGEKFDPFVEFNCNTESKLQVIQNVVKNLPKENKQLKLRWTSRLVLAPHLKAIENYFTDASFLNPIVLNSTKEVERTLNAMVEEDTHGSLRDAFDDTDFVEPLQALLLSTIYFRSNWRVSPTLLNLTLPFYDGVPRAGLEHQEMQAMRINDVIGYADLKEWDAEAVEIEYATKGLSLIAVIPRGTSLRNVAQRLGSIGVNFVCERLQQKRIAVTMPIYTLRMTLLLPNKMQLMGLSQLFTDTNSSNVDIGSIQLSHAVQGIMFWAEAGRNAYKDDGIMWDEKPDMQLVIDRPYVYFVRWNGLTLLTGNFVL